ncbi:hypothetical protein [Streptosporangium amethystogenes]|uniref:hypothetical protein n=1 Tax=Streptosporangium amethystogenes TaxID=2002 RepID=UPI0012FA198D|nr:hypothetical protein [Streptosporangium amethystogenes]
MIFTNHVKNRESILSFFQVLDTLKGDMSEELTREAGAQISAAEARPVSGPSARMDRIPPEAPRAANMITQDHETSGADRR